MLPSLAQGPPSTKRRDDMLAWQQHFQRVWAQDRIFEADAPSEGVLPAPLPDQQQC